MYQYSQLAFPVEEGDYFLEENFTIPFEEPFRYQLSGTLGCESEHEARTTPGPNVNCYGQYALNVTLSDSSECGGYEDGDHEVRQHLTAISKEMSSLPTEDMYREHCNPQLEQEDEEVLDSRKRLFASQLSQDYERTYKQKCDDEGLYVSDYAECDLSEPHVNYHQLVFPEDSTLFDSSINFQTDLMKQKIPCPTRPLPPPLISASRARHGQAQLSRRHSFIDTPSHHDFTLQVAAGVRWNQVKSICRPKGHLTWRRLRQLFLKGTGPTAPPASRRSMSATLLEVYQEATRSRLNSSETTSATTSSQTDAMDLPAVVVDAAGDSGKNHDFLWLFSLDDFPHKGSTRVTSDQTVHSSGDARLPRPANLRLPPMPITPPIRARFLLGDSPTEENTRVHQYELTPPIGSSSSASVTKPPAPRPSPRSGSGGNRSDTRVPHPTSYPLQRGSILPDLSFLKLEQRRSPLRTTGSANGIAKSSRNSASPAGGRRSLAAYQRPPPRRFSFAGISHQPLSGDSGFDSSPVDALSANNLPEEVRHRHWFVDRGLCEHCAAILEHELATTAVPLLLDVLKKHQSESDLHQKILEALPRNLSRIEKPPAAGERHQEALPPPCSMHSPSPVRKFASDDMLLFHERLNSPTTDNGPSSSSPSGGHPLQRPTGNRSTRVIPSSRATAGPQPPPAPPPPPRHPRTATVETGYFSSDASSTSTTSPLTMVVTTYPTTTSSSGLDARPVSPPQAPPPPPHGSGSNTTKKSVSFSEKILLHPINNAATSSAAAATASITSGGGGTEETTGGSTSTPGGSGPTTDVSVIPRSCGLYGEETWLAEFTFGHETASNGSGAGNGHGAPTHTPTSKTKPTPVDAHTRHRLSVESVIQAVKSVMSQEQQLVSCLERGGDTTDHIADTPTSPLSQAEAMAALLMAVESFVNAMWSLVTDGMVLTGSRMQIFGSANKQRPKMWALLEESCRVGVGPRLLSTLMSNMRANIGLSQTERVRFHAFICACLNSKALQLWLDSVVTNASLMKKFFHDDAFLNQCRIVGGLAAELYADLLTNLDLLLHLRFLFPLVMPNNTSVMNGMSSPPSCVSPSEDSLALTSKLTATGGGGNNSNNQGRSGATTSGVVRRPPVGPSGSIARPSVLNTTTSSSSTSSCNPSSQNQSSSKPPPPMSRGAPSGERLSSPSQPSLNGFLHHPFGHSRRKVQPQQQQQQQYHALNKK